MNTNRFFTTKNIAKIAILSTIAFVLMIFAFPLPFIPKFYSLDFSEVAVLVGGFSLGPLAAVTIEGVKIILKTLTEGTSTAYVGEVANFIIGCAFCVPASFIYQKNKTKTAAIKALTIGGITMVFVGLLMNYFILLPAYSFFYKMDMSVLIGMGSVIFPFIQDKLTFVLFATTPFNIIKAILVGILTFAIYKHISPLLKK